MLKKLLILLLILVFASVPLGYFFGSKILGKSIKAGVETLGPKITQTPVKLDDVKLSILSGNGQLSGLNVGNPEGFSSENIFALGKIEIDIEPQSIFNNEIVINKIYIKEPHISYEKTLKTSNIKELLKNIEASTGSDETADETTDKTEEPTKDDSVAKEQSKEVLIKEFIIEKPNVFLGVIGLGTTVTLPSIELTDVSSSEDKIAATILEQVITKLFENIKTATANNTGATVDAAINILDSVRNQSEEPLKKVNDDIKNLLLGD